MTLEEKILEAKELGIKFVMLPAGHGFPAKVADTIHIGPGWTDQMFETELDLKLEQIKGQSFVGILMKHKLI